ncbi:hypothetical protein ABIE65_004576 [Constrictibacter sp. MBR-5]|uniref:hypothetical protein n=1 Tax=Constrictibacter sp. MBR-5 TaxID=3156467 RepID=UPI003396CD01
MIGKRSRRGAVDALDFRNIANGVVGDAPPESLGSLLLDIADLADGVATALDILHMHFYRDRQTGRPRHPSMIDVGRTLLRRVDFSKTETYRDYTLGMIIRICCTGADGEETARDICLQIRAKAEMTYLSRHELRGVLKGLFKAQPGAALDLLLLPTAVSTNRGLFRPELDSKTPIEKMDPEVLRHWADKDPAERYPVLSRVISTFGGKSENDENGMSPLFLMLLDSAPDKRAFLGDLWTRLHPVTWSGSLADILTQRKAQLMALCDSSHAVVREWVEDLLPKLDHWIEQERKNDRDGEQSFE